MDDLYGKFVAGKLASSGPPNSRVLHACATLAFPQMLGSIVIIVARPTVPLKIRRSLACLWNIGNGFKHRPLGSVPFWVMFVCQVVLVLGYCWYRRKEQLGWYVVTLIVKIFFV